MSVDLSTASGVLAFARRERERMASEFDRNGCFERRGFSFDAWVFATHSVNDVGVTGERLAGVEAVRASMPIAGHALDPVRQKDAYAFILTKFAAVTRAIGTLFMTEMWWAVIVTPKDAADPEAAVMAERAARPASLEDWDDRKEALYMCLEHVAVGRRVWVAIISRNPTRLHAWEEKPMADMEGRFVGIVEVRS